MAAKHLLSKVEDLDIKNYDGENIPKIVSHIRAATHRICQAGSGIMPKDYSRTLIEQMQMSSCNKFNEAFRHMQNAAEYDKTVKKSLSVQSSSAATPK